MEATRSRGERMIPGELVLFAQGDSQSQHTVGLILRGRKYTNTYSNGTSQTYETFDVLWNTGEVITCFEGNLTRAE